MMIGQKGECSLPVKAKNGRLRGSAWLCLIVFLSATFGMVINWRAPGLALYSRNWLIRARGPLPLPTDIAIVAVDDESLKQYGRFPWPRDRFAQLLDKLREAHPRAIALDVLFTDPTDPESDNRLAAAIQEAGNVVSAAQLAQEADGQVVWLRPLPPLERASAAVGHVEVSTEVNGVAESFLARKADDRGLAEWAMAIQAIQVGEGAAASAIEDLPGAIRFGTHTFRVQADSRSIEIESARPRALKSLRGQWIPIEYIGPPGAFSPATFGFAEVLQGKVPKSAFTNKYVVVGVTAAGLGDRFTSPFVHREELGGDQNGVSMSGAEVLANSITTLLRGRAYADTPDLLAWLEACLAALATIGGLSAAQGRHETMKQTGIIVLLPLAMIALGYYVFARWLVYPPLIPVLFAAAAAVPMTFLRRNLQASRELDHQIVALGLARKLFQGVRERQRLDPTPIIMKISDARLALILLETAPRRYRLLASQGIHFAEAPPPDFALDVAEQTTLDTPVVLPASGPLRAVTARVGLQQAECCAYAWRITASPQLDGLLVLVTDRGRIISPERARLASELARSYLAAWSEGRHRPGALPRGTGTQLLPKGLAWKTRALRGLQEELMREAQFVERSLRSVGDGLLVTGPAGDIVFANDRATEILGLSEHTLLLSNLFDRLGLGESVSLASLERLLVDRNSVERDITIAVSKPRHYILRLNPVTEGGDSSGRVLGIVASLSDITKQQELQQMKTDVITLVTHEMRTPLTAIQGMSEVLAEFEMEPDRRREMHSAINEEARRLARMIDEYLDITRLEVRARPLRKEALHPRNLVEHVLLLLEPVAMRSEVRLIRNFGSGVPAILADPDLLSRAVNNVVGNAIKFSRPGQAVRVSVIPQDGDVLISVEDSGPGIAEKDLPRIFEKFYRVQSVDTPGKPGSGLGLAYVREIMEAHGGSVTVESRVGIGSRFSLRLPRGDKKTQTSSV